MNLIAEIEKSHRKPALPKVQTGDTVRVHQLITEGKKTRTQVFEGVIIRRHRMNELTASITVRRIASGVGVEKTFLMHSPNISKIQIMRRAKVRRNFLSYLRERRGKSARLQELAFDKAAANDLSVPEDTATPVDDTTTDDAQDETIDVEENEDALNDAEPLQEVEKAEGKAAAADDDPAKSADADAEGIQEEANQEIDEGLDRAEPGEGKAVKS
jgi:large subunit ribosomal protein L19